MIIRKSLMISMLAIMIAGCTRSEQKGKDKESKDGESQSTSEGQAETRASVDSTNPVVSRPLSEATEIKPEDKQEEPYIVPNRQVDSGDIEKLTNEKKKDDKKKQKSPPY